MSKIEVRKLIFEQEQSTTSLYCQRSGVEPRLAWPNANSV